ncbi:unnamed protein product, partial [Taenia asiatica]|uniref:WD_REPEATS_REGION domain-containing protein n=1 Tax=Taenia asiatica TaxID=60517 RepID=A0A158R8J0_TAEAS
VHKYESIFTSKCASGSEFYPIRGLASQEIICSATARYDEDCSLFAYGLKGGFTIFVSLSHHDQEMQVLPLVSRCSTLWPGVTPSFSNKQDCGNLESPVSMAFLDDRTANPILVCVCKDHYLRVWDLKHCHCISTIDLLECLNTFSSCFNAFTATKQRALAFTPGANHCVKTSKNFAIIYLELVPTKRLPLPPIQMTYWIWVRLNSYGNKIALDVVCVEPIKQMANPQVSFSPTVCSLVDFVPFLSHNTSNTSDFSMGSSSVGVAPPTLSVWSVMDVPSEEGYTQPTLQLIKFNSDGSRLPPMPTSSLISYANMQLWQEPLPQSIFVPKRSYNDELGVSDGIAKEDVDLTAFMDFIFTPGRFAKVAIHDAFKSLKQSYHLPQKGYSPDDVVTIMRDEITHALISVLRPSLSVAEFQTLLRTFHQIVVDYHQRASEPLGLFCVESNGDVIVVRRSGLSVARRLQSTEEAFLNPSFPICCPTESDLEALTSNHRAAKLRAREYVISHCRRIVRGLTQCQFWLEHERKICENPENFQHTEAVLNQLLANLPANKLFDWGEDGLIEGIDDAFDWFLELFFTPNPIESIANELEGEEVDEESVDDVLTRKSLHRRSPDLLGFGSSLSAELLRQGVWQATNTSLRFCVAMHLLWRHWNHHFSTSLGSSRIEGRLQQIYRCLAVIQWLTITRAAPSLDRNFLSSAWTHLKMLGMEDRSMDFAPLREFLRNDYHSTSNRMYFQFCGLSLFEEIILSAPEIFSGFSVGTNKPSWRTHSSIIITALQKLLCPILNNGETIVPILKHLLLGARCRELLTLCKCLAPNAFDIIDMKSLPSFRRDEQIGGRSKSILRNGSWWPGDVNALYVCAFLALLWSGLTDEAVEQYIQGSLYLRRRLLSRLYAFAECSPELALDENVVVPCSLLGKLFPAEFAPGDSLDFPTLIQDSRGIPSTPLLVDEVQIRYLIKAMPVLEQLAKSQHVISLCEYALEIIQKASSDASARGLLDFEANSRIASPVCVGAPVSAMDGWITAKGGRASHTGLFPTSAVCTDDEKFLSLAQNLSELEAVLRTRIFRHELAIGNIARAHASVISNPDKAKQRDCLHLLITTLCDRGKTTDLVNFEYGSLENEFVSTLKLRARAVDVLPKSVSRQQALKEGAVKQEENIFYPVLYSYYMRRSQFHSAVEVCFEQAVRLAEESALLPLTPLRRAKCDGSWGAGSWVLEALQQQALCLSACINTLELLPFQDQWVVIRDSKTAFLSNAESCALTSGVSWAFDLEEEGDASENRLGERGSEEMLASGSVLNPSNVIRRQAGGRVLQLTDLEHHYLVVQARLRLAQVSWEQGVLRARSTSLHDLYSALISTALYEEAFRLLVAFDLDPLPLVTTITSRCVALAEHQQTTKDALAPCLPALTNSTAPLNTEKVLVTKSVAALSDYLTVASDVVEANRKNNLLDLYWSLLKVLLTGLDSCGILMVGDKPRSKWDFHLLACRSILTKSSLQLSSIQLPCWLMHFLPSRPSGPAIPLLRLFLDHNRLREAYRLAYAILLTVIGHETGQCPALLKEVDLQQLQMNLRSSSEHVASSSIHLPHNLLIRLLEALAIVSHKSQAYRFVSITVFLIRSISVL